MYVGASSEGVVEREKGKEEADSAQKTVWELETRGQDASHTANAAGWVG